METEDICISLVYSDDSQVFDLLLNKYVLTKNEQEKKGIKDILMNVPRFNYDCIETLYVTWDETDGFQYTCWEGTRRPPIYVCDHKFHLDLLSKECQIEETMKYIDYAML